MHVLWSLIQPTLSALSPSPLPFSLRWRLLIFQPLTALIFTFKALPWILTPNSYSVHHLPTRAKHSLRTLAFQPPSRPTPDSRLRPLVLLIHGGGFVGGLPDMLAEFAQTIARRTGAVVVAPTYRLAPRWRFPAAIDDVDDAVNWVVENAEKEWGADRRCITVCGLSAGGNLAFATSLGRREVKGLVTFYAPVDLRLHPRAKPRPDNFPKSDPLGFLQELYDTYASDAKKECPEDPRCNPIFAPLDDLPRNILLQIPKIDILLHEQTVFVERLRNEARGRGELLEDGEEDLEGNKRRIMANFYEKGFHGWVELSKTMVDQESWTMATESSFDFINEVNGANGYAF
ncbi:putative lipase/esterase family protein [Eremomyces bilateralis CBS 781.70]|uniref:Lipase/esterase family protein n=1 Tax=Eremomyces bilateralis CBS 781.70 TaxID=1392243 RepID=A0A6G1FYZ5_9PEZI|nr:putative lipase/esterase family protein [Eremomyces bilateralis CBS 781.70]KAF1810921.1 putative lipase/esterase family protein [Eremomyces bilateralis CBS 781.70]